VRLRIYSFFSCATIWVNWSVAHRRTCPVRNDSGVFMPLRTLSQLECATLS
jgi:hypothetical protein